MKSLITFFALTLLFTGSSLAATCNSLGSGDWNTASTWSCGAVPTGGSTIRIHAGDTVTISTVINIIGAAVTITIDGVLMFDSPTSQLNLPCNSVIIISSSGSIQSTGTGQATQAIRICRGDVWVGSDGTLTGPIVIGIALPIELTYFNAEPSGSDISFSWQTATEMNNDFFTIEGSTDGFSWRSMHRIEGAGTTEEAQNYAFQSPNDNKLLYFRLKQTDFDGKTSYSDIVAVELIRNEFVVFPNPSNGEELTINLSSKESGVINILNSVGRVVYSNELTGQKVVNLRGLKLNAGTYIIQIQQANKMETQRLIVR